VAAAHLRHHAWQLAGSWFPTGERTSFKGITPRRNFDVTAKSGGAFELTARYGVITIDDAAFPTYANPAGAARRANAWAAGVNWHLARDIKFVVNYERTTFTSGAATGNRAPETFVVARYQTAF